MWYIAVHILTLHSTISLSWIEHFICNQPRAFCILGEPDSPYKSMMPYLKWKTYIQSSLKSFLHGGVNKKGVETLKYIRYAQHLRNGIMNDISG